MCVVIATLHRMVQHGSHYAQRYMWWLVDRGRETGARTPWESSLTCCGLVENALHVHVRGVCLVRNP